MEALTRTAGEKEVGDESLRLRGSGNVTLEHGVGEHLRERDVENCAGPFGVDGVTACGGLRADDPADGVTVLADLGPDQLPQLAVTPAGAGQEVGCRTSVSPSVVLLRCRWCSAGAVGVGDAGGSASVLPVSQWARCAAGMGRARW